MYRHQIVANALLFIDNEEQRNFIELELQTELNSLFEADFGRVECRSPTYGCLQSLTRATTNISAEDNVNTSKLNGNAEEEVGVEITPLKSSKFTLEIGALNKTITESGPSKTRDSPKDSSMGIVSQTSIKRKKQKKVVALKTIATRSAYSGSTGLSSK